MLDGLLDLPWWGQLLCVLLTTHITIVSVTLYLHRCQAHRALDLHPAVSHFFRLWLWLTTAQVTKEWIAIHRKHHAHTEAKQDPHSPYVYGIRKVLLEGAELYRTAAEDETVCQEFGHGAPNDWLENNLYTRFRNVGIVLWLGLCIVLYGPIGLTYWAIQMAWIPIFAAGIINGAGHYWGYRNFEPRDGSTNLTNIGILIGGEEMHNNHHAYPSSAKFSVHWWEFDIGWMYICILAKLGLAKVKKVAPQPIQIQHREALDIETMRAMLTSQLHLMADYAKRVTLPVLQSEFRPDSKSAHMLRDIRTILTREPTRMTESQTDRLETLLSENNTLRIIYDHQQRLKSLWTQRYQDNDSMLRALVEWCHEAEQSGIRVLEEFAQSLRGYSLAPIYNHVPR